SASAGPALAEGARPNESERNQFSRALGQPPYGTGKVLQKSRSRDWAAARANTCSRSAADGAGRSGVRENRAAAGRLLSSRRADAGKPGGAGSAVGNGWALPAHADAAGAEAGEGAAPVGCGPFAATGRGRLLGPAG